MGVALCIGDGKMIEAPRSGLRVWITSVGYSGLMRYAMRLLWPSPRSLPPSTYSAPGGLPQDPGRASDLPGLEP